MLLKPAQRGENAELFSGELLSPGFSVGDPTPSFMTTGSVSSSTVICSL
ncbi:hypothetical protein ABT169_20820 [Streptomyces sp. NPDC001616]